MDEVSTRKCVVGVYLISPQIVTDGTAGELARGLNEHYLAECPCLQWLSSVTVLSGDFRLPCVYQGAVRRSVKGRRGHWVTWRKWIIVEYHFFSRQVEEDE